jgi:hypothetical protein
MLRVCRRYAKRHLWTVQWTWDQDRLARDTEQRDNGPENQTGIVYHPTEDSLPRCLPTWRF